VACPGWDLDSLKGLFNLVQMNQSPTGKSGFGIGQNGFVIAPSRFVLGQNGIVIAPAAVHFRRAFFAG
jgi:hypothetical protein